MTAVRVGRVCTRKGARIHLAIDGRTCGASRGAHISRPVTKPLLVDHANLCKRCFTPARIARAEAALVTATGIEAARNRRLLAGVVQSMKTPAQLAADAAMVADMVAHLEAVKPVDPDQAAWDRLDALMDATTQVAPVVQALPVEQRRRAWADLRREFAETHPQPAAA